MGRKRSKIGLPFSVLGISSFDAGFHPETPIDPGIFCAILFKSSSIFIVTSSLMRSNPEHAISEAKWRDMRVTSFVLTVLILASAAWAQDEATLARAAAGCGSSGIQFDVKTDNSRHPMQQPEPGKATVYVFEHEKVFRFEIGAATTRVGLDGQWQGANHGESFFFFPADPGKHHLCVDWPSSQSRLSSSGAAANFIAEPGTTYYFLAELEERDKHPPEVRLKAADSAEGEFLIWADSLSTSHPKRK